MIDPTRLAAIKALKPTPGPWKLLPFLNGRRNLSVRAGLARITAISVTNINCEANAELIVAAADPEYGLQALAAEVERLQEREKPVKVNDNGRCPCNAGNPHPPNGTQESYCWYCGRALQWK